VTAATRFDDGDIRAIDPLFQGERRTSALRVATALGALAASLGHTAVQAAIAWVLAQPGVACALCGPSTVVHLEENAAAAGWRLTAQELDELETVFTAEDARLAQAETQRLAEILKKDLPADPEQAFRDLLYAIECLVAREALPEGDAMGLIQTLLVLRGRSDATTRQDLLELQQLLRSSY
jgi:hypothetical protein